MRISKSPAFWVISTVFVVALAANTGHRVGFLPNNSWAGERPSLETMSNESIVLREGTELSEVRGKFRVANDRFLFVDDSNGRTFKCLENLMLQRIASAIKDDERRVNWVITAKVSEFSGENFVMIDRAVRAR